jgi:hypothetical protein
MNYLKNESNLKALLIDYLFSSLDASDVIGSEVMFGERKGIADLLILSHGMITAYEIKAQNDDFRKINVQLEDYNNTFDFVYLVTTEKHYLKARNNIKRNNGIILIYNDSSVKIIKVPKQNINLNKSDLLSTMTINYLKTNYKAFKKNQLAHIYRESLKDIDQENLKQGVYEFLYQRIKPKYENFIKEKGNKTHFEDVALLSFKNKKIII